MGDDEERAFEEFVARSADRLLLTAVLLVGGDRAAGEDLLQGAFERTYRHWSRIAQGHPEAYVRRALANAATSRWRRMRARVPEVPLLAEHAGDAGRPPAGADVAVADHAERLSVRDGLVRALLALPPRQRAVLVLRYLDDLPEGEVAAALGCSVGAVRSQASRGLARLRASDHIAALTGTAASPDTGPARRPGRVGSPRRVEILTNEPDDAPPSRAAVPRPAAPPEQRPSPARPVHAQAATRTGPAVPLQHRPRALLGGRPAAVAAETAAISMTARPGRAGNAGGLGPATPTHGGPR